MAKKIFRGDAQPVAQVNTVTVGGTAAASQVYTVTINSKAVSYTSDGADTNDTIAAALAALLVACTFEEFAEITWTVDAAIITGTATTPGTYFVNTSGATGTGTLVTATATASKGPSHYDDVNNWSTGSIPVNGDDVYFIGGSAAVKYGLNQSGVTLASLNIASTFAGTIGNLDFNGTYYEYRGKYLQTSATIVNIGDSAGGGSSLLKLDLGSVNSTINVVSTGSPSTQGYPAVALLCTHASTVLNPTSGTIGVAVDAGSVSTISVANVGFLNAQTTDVNLTFGEGCTLGAINQSGGTVFAASSITSITMESGLLNATGPSINIGTIEAEGGSIYYQSNGTITTTTLGTGATLDLRRDLRARTMTNLTIRSGASFLDSFKTVTFTNPVLVECSLAECTIDLGGNFNLQRS